ncbi:MAG: beta-ketoacyl synthase N-terminal-like domain-containing protein [Gammaproteobacteria bacterium]|nr:beta-ketoacyl synthase N-terminal-like domain-containing protein [Gammaproteobacteria bacterium]
MLGTVGECVNKKDLKITKKSEIIYQGPALMRGYFRDMAATEVAIHDGYLHTQDLGRLDRSGNLFIIGRTKELIVFSDGKKAMPEQIEKQYAEIEGIKEFAVFGVSSTAYQDTSMAVIAYVVAEKHDHKITTQALFQHASRLKSPYRISDVFVVDKIPRSSTLKIKRYELASHYLEGKKSTRLKNNVSKKELSEIIVCFQSLLIDKKECITPDISFAELGIDSLLAAQLCVALNEKLGLSLSPTAFWFSRSIHELHDYVYKKKTTVVQENSTDLQNKHNHIAIISVDCVFPGATNTDTFWKNLCDSKDAIIETPSSRWNNDDYYDAYALAPGKTNSREGGFIQLPTDFPCEKFGLKPRVSQALDPQQKILLMSVQRLLETTNHQKKIENWQGSNTGFFLGVGFPDFLIQTFKTTKLEQVNPYHGIGTADFSSVGRIAYHFGLEGPAMLIKTACSSALVAVHQAIRALQAGDCNAAIAGGINMEGCGLVLLKRYNDALRDGDKILSVIMGSSINQDGTSNGLATPNGKSQINCYKAALNNAKLSPEEIGFIEAHGSGTQLGDAIEMQSIQAVYDQDRSSNNPLYVGAVKSAIGHCESAAGIAGLIKTMHVLNHQLIPPNLHYHTPNPNISFAHSAVKLPLKLTRFSHPCEYAAVSSFGVAGTNAHMILKKA